MIALIAVLAALGAAKPPPEKEAVPSAPTPNTSLGWVKPEQKDLVRVFGERFKSKVSDPPLLAINAEEWTSPYISQDRSRLFYGTTSGLLEARELSSWEVIWSKKGLGSIGAAMAEYHGRLLVGSGSTLLAIDEITGDSVAPDKWKPVDLLGSVGGRIVVTGTVALIPVRPNSVVAVDVTRGGDPVWRTKRPTPEGITMRGQAPVTVDARRGRAYVGFSDGVVEAVSLKKGDVLWQVSLTKPTTAFADVDAAPMLVDDDKALIVASYAGGLAKLEAESGKILWRKDVLRITAMTRTSESGLIVATNGDGQALGIYPENGKVRWRYKVKKGSPTEPIWLGRGMVLIACSKSAHAVLRADDGRPVQLIWPGSGSSAPPAWRDPDLAFLSNKGLILALRYGGGTGITVGESFLHAH